MIRLWADPRGYKIWYKDDKRYRDGGLPACEWSDGSKSWYKDGKLHRDGDLPAVEDSDGTKLWYKHGERHRDGDLPAIEFPSGSKIWYKDGKLHRVGGPSKMYKNKTPEWYFEDHLVTEEQHDFIYRMHKKYRKRIREISYES
jgi:hypothetical protein